MPCLLYQHHDTSTDIEIVKNSTKFMASQMLLQVLRSPMETPLELLTNSSLGTCCNIIKSEAMSTHVLANHFSIKISRIFFNAQAIHTSRWNKNALESLESCWCDHQARNIPQHPWPQLVGPHLASSSPKCERGLHPRSFWQSNSEPPQMGLINHCKKHCNKRHQHATFIYQLI